MCPKCKAEIRELNQNFCGECAADLRGLQTRCAVCGCGIHEELLDAGHNHHSYCIECGASWMGAIPPAAA